MAPSSSEFCLNCANTGHVCDNHPTLPWSGIAMIEGSCGCGAGMPCPSCCDEIPMDDTRSIVEAFTPRHLR